MSDRSLDTKKPKMRSHWKGQAAIASLAQAVWQSPRHFKYYLRSRLHPYGAPS